MRVSRRIASTLALAFLAGSVGIMGAAGAFLVDDLRTAEAMDAERRLDRVEDLLAADQRDLTATAQQVTGLMAALFGDGAQQGGSTTADDGNGTAETQQVNTTAIFQQLFVRNRVDLIGLAFANETGGPQFFSILLDPRGGGFTEAGEVLNASLAGSSFRDPVPVGGAHEGILVLNGTPYMLAAVAFNITAASEFTEGGMILGRALSGSYAQHLGEGLDAPLRFDPPGEPALRRLSLADMEASRTVRDVNGDAAASLTLVLQREAFQAGVRSFGAFALVSLGLGGMLTAASWWTVRGTVTSRLEKVRQDMQEIQQQALLDRRIALEGDDELSDMADAFDGVMEMVQENVRKLDGFAAVVSHDLQGPLSSFRLNLAVLKMKAQKAGDDEQTARLEALDRLAVRMGDRIASVLAWSRRAPPAPTQTSMDLLWTSVAHDLQERLEASGAQVDCQAPDDLLADPEQLMRVLQNLVANGIKYGRPGVTPRIQVRSRRKGDRVEVCVRDNGMGFNDQDALVMLRPFQRLDNAAGIEGHGLGLAAVDQIVQAHGGTVRLYGEPGRGARVIFDLPAAPQAASS
ncbi:MAG: ATP-binding protein [Thermoplasmatota archaeon]